MTLFERPILREIISWASPPTCIALLPVSRDIYDEASRALLWNFPIYLLSPEETFSGWRTRWHHQNLLIWSMHPWPRWEELETSIGNFVRFLRADYGLPPRGRYVRAMCMYSNATEDAVLDMDAMLQEGIPDDMAIEDVPDIPDSTAGDTGDKNSAVSEGGADVDDAESMLIHNLAVLVRAQELRGTMEALRTCIPTMTRLQSLGLEDLSVVLKACPAIEDAIASLTSLRYFKFSSGRGQVMDADKDYPIDDGNGKYSYIGSSRSGSATPPRSARSRSRSRLSGFPLHSWPPRSPTYRRSSSRRSHTST